MIVCSVPGMGHSGNGTGHTGDECLSSVSETGYSDSPSARPCLSSVEATLVTAPVAASRLIAIFGSFLMESNANRVAVTMKSCRVLKTPRNNVKAALFRFRRKMRKASKGLGSLVD